VFSFADPVPATIFAVYAAIVGLSDNVLKPLLLGRGVDLPAIVVLLGAIGGMVQFGIIGLFIGAVILGLGYRIIADWIRPGESDSKETGDEQPA
jgi:predicted PurR-regulated permease PerM